MHGPNTRRPFGCVQLCLMALGVIQRGRPGRSPSGWARPPWTSVIWNGNGCCDMKEWGPGTWGPKGTDFVGTSNANIYLRCFE
jgi:hypothetical protein